MNWKKIVSFFLLLIVAAVFFLSGYTKLIAITPFEWSFMDLGIPPTLAAILARAFVALEFAICALLIAHVYLKSFTYKLTQSILAFFTLYLLMVLIINGNNGNCGCFGEEFYMTPLEGILKNLGLMAIVFFLQKKYPGRDYQSSMYVGVAVTMLAFAFVFIKLPMTKQPQPINLAHLYNHQQQIQTPNIDLKKGKHVIAFLSLTCPHCKHAVVKMSDMYEQDPSLPLYIVYNGDTTLPHTFLKETGPLPMPNNIFYGPEEFREMAGDYVPSIYFVQDGIKVREVNYHELSGKVIHQWLKQ